MWTDGRPLPTKVGGDDEDSLDPTYMGYSVGRWEDDYNFVIDTTGLDERTWLLRDGTPHSVMAHCAGALDPRRPQHHEGGDDDRRPEDVHEAVFASARTSPLGAESEDQRVAVRAVRNAGNACRNRATRRAAIPTRSRSVMAAVVVADDRG